MSSFSPKTYQIYQYDDTDLGQISYYYNCFTLLEKPNKNRSGKDRNVYKISLAQMLHYMVDFGIGYNSKCVTGLSTQQQFNLCRYVNRHATPSPKRPATVADLKKKILNVVEEMVRRTVRYDGRLMRKTNDIFPKYLFTLDTTLTPLKLKQMTGHDYVEVSDFENFAYASGGSMWTMPKYQNGYVPISAVRCVPQHTHDVDPKMNDSIGYSWSMSLWQVNEGTGHIAWGNDQTGNIELCDHSGCHWDFNVKEVSGMASKDVEPAIAGPMACSWDKPSGVSCFENDIKDPLNTVNGPGGNTLSIRYHGRRYRLFKKVS